MGLPDGTTLHENVPRGVPPPGQSISSASQFRGVIFAMIRTPLRWKLPTSSVRLDFLRFAVSLNRKSRHRFSHVCLDLRF